MQALEEQDEIRQAFQSEGYGFVAQARQLLAQQTDDTRPPLQQAAQALKEGADRVGLLDISNLAHQLENELERQQKAAQNLTPEGLETLSSYVDGIEQFLNYYFRHTGNGISIDQLLKPEENQKLTRQLLELYQIESREHIQEIHALLLKLETGKKPPKQAIEAIFRAVHSIKGDSNAIGQLEIAEQAHAIETQLSSWQSSKAKLDDSQLDILFRAVADLEQQLFAILDNETPVIVEAESPAAMPAAPQQTAVSHAPPEILALFMEEAAELAQDILLQLQQLQQAPSDTALEQLFRNLHTLKGNASALDQEAVAQAATPCEEALKPYRNRHLSWHTDSLEGLLAVLAPLWQALAQGGVQVPPLVVDRTALPTPPLAATSPQSQADDLDEIAPEIREIFLLEAQELVDNVLGQLLAFESGTPLEQQGLDEVFRAVHTLKGNANALGLERMGALAHDFESLISQERNLLPRDAGAVAETLFEAFDPLRLAVKRLESPEASLAVSPAPAELEPQVSLEGIPEEVREIFLLEARELSELISSQLILLESSDEIETGGLDDIYRAVHTLKGNANALGIDDIGRLTHDFEHVLSARRTQLPLPAPPLASELFQAFEKLQKTLQLLQAPVVSEVFAQIVPEHDIPEEVREIFLTEARELIDSITQELMRIEQGEKPLSQSSEEIYRAMHTLKGNANALGLDAIGSQAHDLESLLSQLRSHPESYTPAQAEQLFKGVEHLRAQIESLAPAVVKDPLRDTHQHHLQHTTQSRSREQLMDAVRRDQNLFRDFEKRLSTGSRKIDFKSTGEIKVEKLPQVTSAPSNIEETIRVSVNKIDKLINLSDELLLSRINQAEHLREIRQMQSDIADLRRELARQREAFQTPEALSHHDHLAQSLQVMENRSGNLSKVLKQSNAAFGLLVDEIQHHARATRMLPAAYLINPLRLVVRNTGAKLQKKVQLNVLGEEIEMDRLLIERLKDPLGHLLRNAIDHGLESAEERRQAQKPIEAKVSLVVSQAGNMIRFQVHDDGRGINYAAIREKAVRLGLVASEQAASLSEYELHALMFSAGFSTAAAITDVSGRGVGLDVVKASIDALNGSIEISSEPGRGTLFTLQVPLTLTSFDAFLVVIAGQIFALPRSAILATLSVKADTIHSDSLSETVEYDGQPLRAISLKQMLQLEGQGPVNTYEPAVLVLESGHQRYALLIDALLESQQMVMKNLGSQLQKVSYVSGATILGNGEPVVVLNMTEIANELSVSRIDGLALGQLAPQGPAPAQRSTRVLVVDDSVTTRTLEKNILEASGFEVIIAKNGYEGQQAVLQHMPDIDLVITDVEMPVMNGFEFAGWLKHQSDYRDTPVIMVTSLASPEFRAKGFEAGINAYIVKGEFNQQHLLDTIEGLLKRPAPSAGRI
ncbi:MAG: Hpt domain-containing protein [Candidatus Sericytochromatia bacterium]